MNPAFAYIYDEFLSERRLERDAALLETELARRGIEGRTIRLAMFRQPKEVITDLMRGPVKNIIFVGNDHTLEKMMSFLPDLDITFGYVPLIQPARIGELLGIPFGPAAVDVLAARLVDQLDVGKINDRYFFTEVSVPEGQAALDVEGQYKIGPAAGGAIAIRNLGVQSEQMGFCAHPQDGRLEGMIQAKIKSTGVAFWRKGTLSESRVYLTKGQLVAEKPIEVFVDGQSLRGKSFTLSIVPKKLKMITGKQKAWQPQPVISVPVRLATNRIS